MPRYDQSEVLDVQQSIPCGNSTATQQGTAVAFDDYEAATVVFSVGTVSDGTHTPVVAVSDDGGSTWSTLTDADLVGSLSNLSSDSVQSVGFLGQGYTHIRAEINVTGATGGADYEAFVIRGVKGSL